ncbi:OB-fold nucleic acid binding domain-containing protein [Micropruina sp.]|uniref:OB-fold nucleic acid binding domain-containing protein n=1 Tax=Micropruina sp. TaxID=2737536 RepID=UPI0039E6B734
MFTVEDLEASIEVLLFPKAYQLVALQLATDTIVRIRGKVVGKDEGVEWRGTDVSFPGRLRGAIRPGGDLAASGPLYAGGGAAAPDRADQPSSTPVRVRLTTSTAPAVWKLEETLSCSVAAVDGRPEGAARPILLSV